MHGFTWTPTVDRTDNFWQSGPFHKMGELEIQYRFGLAVLEELINKYHYCLAVAIWPITLKVGLLSPYFDRT